MIVIKEYKIKYFYNKRFRVDCLVCRPNQMSMTFGSRQLSHQFYSVPS